MSKSPTEYEALGSQNQYLQNWDALGAKISRGGTFSGRERNCCFLNTGETRFADVSATTGLDLIDDGRAIAITDWDHDGDLDLWLVNRTGPRVRFLRNDVPSKNHFLSIRLQGTQCNRDAIGARVELYPAGEPNRKRIKTLSAGSGFLSQSSKWVHFGLGKDTKIDRLVVRWPGGTEAEQFTGLQADRHYKIVQGSRSAVQLKFARNVKLSKKPLEPAPATDQARILLTHRRDFFDFVFQELDEKKYHSKGFEAGPILLNLWASWCRPCISELSELSQHQEELQAQGLRILAMCTDLLDSEKETSLAAAKTILDKMSFPFVAGIASRSLVRDLTVLHNQSIYDERPLPLPSSFLIDSQGKVAVIYKGPVSFAQLQQDLAMLDAPAEEIRKSAWPFPGRDGLSLFPIGELGFARSYFEGGYFPEAKLQLEKLVDNHQALAAAGDRKVEASHQSRLGIAHYFLGQIALKENDRSDAKTAFEKSSRLKSPQQANAFIDLALLLARQGETEKVEEHLRQAKLRGAQDVGLLNRLGKAQLSLGRTQRAIENYQSALEIRSDHQELRFNLAVALQKQGRISQAIEEYRTLLRQNPRSLDATNNLAWILATDSQEKYRNAKEAVRLAKRICEATGYRVPAPLDTLAAALAEAGDFEQALQVSQKAMDTAKTKGQTSLLEQLQARHRLYKAGKPFHELRGNR